MSSAIFPVEIMNEIFRSSELDSRTLASCCLLSHKYLESGRKWLYNHITIRLASVRINATGGAKEINEYSQSAANLLSTLRANQPLRSLIRSFDAGRSSKSSGIRSEPVDALATLFSLAPQLRSIDLTDHIASNDKVLRQLDPRCFSQLSEFKVRQLTKLTSTFLSHLRHLRRLYVQHRDTSVGISPLTSRKLTYLSLPKLPDGFDLPSFLSPIASGLQDLRLSFSSLLTLDLVNFFELRRLEVALEDWTSEEAQLWKRLDHCPKLSVLAFHCQEVSRETDYKIFGWDGGLEAHWPPSVRRIEFMDDLSLDRVLIVLAIDEGLAEIAIDPTYIGSGMEKETISFMCEKASVELIFTS